VSGGSDFPGVPGRGRRVFRLRRPGARVPRPGGRPGEGRGGWKVKAAESLKTGLVSAGGGALAVVGLLVAIVGRLVARGGGGNAAALIGMLLVVGAVFAVAILIALTTGVRRIVNRVKLLDTMSREQLRKEAESEKRSFRATTDNVRDVCIDPHGAADSDRSEP